MAPASGPRALHGDIPVHGGSPAPRRHCAWPGVSTPSAVTSMPSFRRQSRILRRHGPRGLGSEVPERRGHLIGNVEPVIHDRHPATAEGSCCWACHARPPHLSRGGSGIWRRRNGLAKRLGPRITCVDGGVPEKRLRAASTHVESPLFFAEPHFLTVNRIHFTEKCSRGSADETTRVSTDPSRGREPFTKLPVPMRADGKALRALTAARAL